MSTLDAPTFPAEEVRGRARIGPAAVFPGADGYGHTLYGQDLAQIAVDDIDRLRIVAPTFVPQRLEALFDLAREPLYTDVELDTDIGGFRSTLPCYLSAFGSTQVASRDLGVAVSAQAGRLGIPMVIGENVVPVNGYGRAEDAQTASALLARLRAYANAVGPDTGGVIIQQSTEDADAEVWNLVYSDPSATALLETGRLGFELKVGQGAKPGLGGMTVVDAATAERLNGAYALDGDVDFGGRVLRNSSPGTFTDEILRQQIRLMRNNFPRSRVWVKLPPSRDVADAARVCWEAGADSVTVDGAEGGSGWAPLSFLGHMGLPLAECLARVEPGGRCLLASGRMWEGTRIVKTLALGARAAGLGRAALLAVDEDPQAGLERLVACLALELRMLTSALGKYRIGQLDITDVWAPGTPFRTVSGSAAVLYEDPVAIR